jgi:hypothetical protein
MSKLDILQRDFQDYVLGNAAGAPAIAAEIADQYGLAPADRLAIYYNAYRIRMREALEEAFEHTWTYVGDDMFAELAAGYLAQHPSQQPNLRWFGDCFAQYTAQALPDYPFIGELAGLEWALGVAFDARDCESLSAADMAKVAPEAWGDLVFGLHPSAQFLEFDWNVVALWQALSKAQEPPDAQQSGAPVCWLVWRTDEQPHFRSLDAFEAHALKRVAQGLPFGEVCAAAGGADDVTQRIAGCLQNWLAQGLLTPASVRPSA